MINALKQKRAALIEEARRVHELAFKENRSMSADEKASYDKIMVDVKEMLADIRRLEAFEEQARALKTGGEPDLNEKGNEDKGFKSLGEQLRAVAAAEQRGATIDQRLVELRAAFGQAENVPADGGFLVQSDFAAELIKRMYSTGILAGRCKRRVISGNSNRLVMNGIDESSRANGSRYGGVQAYWADEADTVTASKLKFKKFELILNKLMAIYYATDEVLQDTSILEQECSDAFTGEIGFKVDDAIIRGTGAGQPLGILNSGALVSVAKEAGQAKDTIVAENLIKMWERLWSPSRGNAVWFINQEVESQLMQAYLSTGLGGQLIYMPPSGLSQTGYGTLFGRPVVPIEQCAALGDKGDIILADLGQYMLIDKGGINAASSMHVRFINDEMAYRMTYRLDGQALWGAALTPYKGSNDLSPFVTLDARA